ncbi:MAG: anti-sigma F factor [Erysipelotrichaceae bacterium]|nr:anti-sigma F factor [Erysipelotrichaceae bacterium]MCI9312335.1 anti-sigma F factor [Erysipelotrichaceae bacterium]
MNEMKLSFLSKAENEPFARTALIAFLMPLNPNVEEIMELKTMIAEALTNAMIHGYEGREDGIVEVSVRYDAQAMVEIIVKDCGCGIADVALAMQPLYTSKAYLERSGMGMTIMSTFADEFHVESSAGNGCVVHLRKQLHGQCEHALQ